MALPTKPAATISGSASNDYLIGSALNDVIEGLAGKNTLEGGAGDDAYLVTTATDIITEFAGEGTDTVYASVSYTLGAEVENGASVGTTGITLTGNTKDNILDGLQNTGADILKGMSGNDTYYIDANDTVVEAAGGGTDTIVSDSSIDLTDSDIGTTTVISVVENAILTGTANSAITGNSAANRLYGNSGDNSISGGAGNDVLNGGAGADAMAGGLGDDIYIVDDSGDTVNEDTSANQGTDTVKSRVDFSLGATGAAFVEKLILTGIGDINATGNGLVNTLTGNSGNNILDGGAGADTMIGLEGDDTYKVNISTDIVTEAVGGGTDKIISSVSITALAANVENLTLGDGTASGGTAALNGTGNGLANTITGNAGINILNGGAGVGIIDTLIGGLGNDTLIGGSGADQLQGEGGADTYRVDADDIITESNTATTAAQRDSVEFTGTAGQTFTLSANVENITLMGTAATSATGNASVNVMTGNSANNSLSGLDGNDTLSGLAGADVLSGGLGNDKITGGAGKDTVTTGDGIDRLVFAVGTTDTVAAAGSIVGVDSYTDLDFASDKIDLTVDVSIVGDGTDLDTGDSVAGSVNEATFVANMNSLLKVAGAGFDTTVSGLNDISAAIVDVTGGTLSGRSFLAVDLNHDNSFTATDFVIEITGYTGILTDANFV